VPADKRRPNLIAAAALGGVQRRVGARDQIDEMMGGGRPGNDAETHSNDAKLADTLMRNCQLFNLAANTFGDANGRAQFGIRHKHKEFFSAIADRKIVGTA